MFHSSYFYRFSGRNTESDRHIVLTFKDCKTSLTFLKKMHIMIVHILSETISLQESSGWFQELQTSLSSLSLFDYTKQHSRFEELEAPSSIYRIHGSLTLLSPSTRLPPTHLTYTRLYNMRYLRFVEPPSYSLSKHPHIHLHLITHTSNHRFISLALGHNPHKNQHPQMKSALEFYRVLTRSG